MPGFCPLCGTKLIRGAGEVTDRAWVECELGHFYFLCEAKRAVRKAFRYGWHRDGRPAYGNWGPKP
jgi:hypothetical protein